MAEQVEKNAYIHFVDERDFKEVSVVGKRKSKKKRKADFENKEGKESSVQQKLLKHGFKCGFKSICKARMLNIAVSLKKLFNTVSYMAQS